MVGALPMSEESLSLSAGPVTEELSNGFSGRHYMGLDNIYYPEICDPTGGPMFGYAADSKTGNALPVGPAVIGLDDRPIPSIILAPNGKHIAGM